jgi:hypothetical protein
VALLVIVLCLVGPPLLMWWMITVQRRVRRQSRERRPETSELPQAPAFVDATRGDDGLTYGRVHPGTDPLAALGPTPELDGIQALQGRR